MYCFQSFHGYPLPCALSKSTQEKYSTPMRSFLSTLCLRYPSTHFSLHSLPNFLFSPHPSWHVYSAVFFSRVISWPLFPCRLPSSWFLSSLWVIPQNLEIQIWSLYLRDHVLICLCRWVASLRIVISSSTYLPAEELTIGRWWLWKGRESVFFRDKQLIDYPCGHHYIQVDMWNTSWTQ